MTSNYALILLILAAACTDPAVIAIRDVAVIDVARGVAVQSQTVVVNGQLIEAVGPSGDVEVPRGAVEIDGRGRFLIPGLWDMHVHTSSDAITRETLLPLFIANGVTGVRIMAADCFEDAEPGCVEEGFPEALPTISTVRGWQEEVLAGRLAGPRMIAGSFYVNSPGPDEPSTAYFPRTEQHGREHARLLEARGVDFIKVYSGLSREAFFGLADEANRLGIPFEGHTPFDVWPSEVSDAGQRSIEHLGFGNIEMECSNDADALRDRLVAEFDAPAPELLPILLEQVATYDPEKCRRLAERFVRNGTWAVPTLMIARLPEEAGGGWRSDPYARFLPDAERALWESREPLYEHDLGDAASRAPHSRWMRELTRMMHDAGVRMMAGSDAGEIGVYWGIGLHQELELLVSAGLSEIDVLRAATVNAAEFLRVTSTLGSIEAGKEADLVLLGANPLEDISNTRRIVSVMARGRWYGRADLDALLAEAEQGR
jgi:hypothetical protein